VFSPCHGEKCTAGKGCGGSGAATFTFRLRVGGSGFRV
jgi:hypothetical protein